MPVLIGEDLAVWEGERDSEVLGSYQMAVSQQCSTAARKPAECCRAGRTGAWSKTQEQVS